MSTVLLALFTVTALLSPSISLIKDPSNITDNAMPFQSLSSTVFPVYGNVYPNEIHYVSIVIGNPPKPYFLDVDTGSDVTWVQCDLPCSNCWKGPHPLYKPRKNGFVKCTDEMCSSVPDPPPPHNRDCDKTPNQCDYEIEYADHLNTYGVLATDFFPLKLSNNVIKKPMLALGCGYNQQGPKTLSDKVDGILGLGRGKASIISQIKNQGITKNVFGHCLSRKSVGYLFFGDDLVPVPGVAWRSMTRIPSGNYYALGAPSFYYSDKNLGVKQAAPVIFDTGATFTYFADQPHQKFLLELENDLKNKPLKQVTDQHKSDMICWKGAKPFKSLEDVKKLFKSLVLKFGDGWRAEKLEIPPENYLIVTKHGNACLGILKASDIGLKDLNIIGGITMQDMLVVYDNEMNRIGWAQKTCNRLPKYIFPLP